jgi:hypothetical protein
MQEEVATAGLPARRRASSSSNSDSDYASSGGSYEPSTENSIVVGVGESSGVIRYAISIH